MRSIGIVAALAAAFAAACGAEPATDVPGVVRSTIASVPCLEGWSVNYPKQHKLFAIRDRLWLIYSDGSGIVSTTTTDGVTWSAPEVVRSYGTLGHRIGLWFDGTRLHYAFATAETGGDVVYRRGVPADDGTIAWDADEQVAYAMGDGHNAMYPKVTVDTLGRPWIGFTLVEGGITTPPYDAIVTRTDATDGTWTTAAGYPATLVADHQDTYPDVTGTPLAGGATLWIYNRDDGTAPYYGRVADATGAWLDEAAVTEHGGKYGLYAIATDDVGTVHLTYRGGGSLRHRARAPDGTWSDEDTLTGDGRHSSITLLGSGDLLVSYLARDAEVHFRQRIAGEWSEALRWADESADGLADDRNRINFNALAAASDTWTAAVVYTTGTEPPYTLRFAGLPR